jgi:hypothetical protein
MSDQLPDASNEANVPLAELRRHIAFRIREVRRRKHSARWAAAWKHYRDMFYTEIAVLSELGRTVAAKPRKGARGGNAQAEERP